MKNTQLTLTISAIAMLLGILTIMIMMSGNFVLSRAPAFGQEEDLGNFSIMDTPELASNANASRTYLMPQQQGEAETLPPSSESPRSEAPQSAP
jgi:hypothetical protein